MKDYSMSFHNYEEWVSTRKSTFIGSILIFGRKCRMLEGPKKCCFN